MDKEELEKALEELRKEQKLGDAELSRLKSVTIELEQTLLRISGAIQVLELELRDLDEDC